MAGYAQEHVVEDATDLAGPDHLGVELVEYFGALLQGLGEGEPGLDLLAAVIEGLLSLDDTFDQYNEGVLNGDQITLRQMADMTSAIANYTEGNQWDKEELSDPHRVREPKELAQVGIEYSLLFDPDTEWQYSDTNTVLLGLVLEQITGETIGHHGTSFPDLTDSSLPMPHAQGYTL